MTSFGTEHRAHMVDVTSAEIAARQFLIALGADIDDENLRETPLRMAEAYAEMLSPRPFSLTTFPNDERYDEMVVELNIPVNSVCEHHLLPFYGVAHVAYIPGAKILGLSKLGRAVEWHARRLQVQERLTNQVANFLDAQLQPTGVGVLIEAEHMCMTTRGLKAPGTKVVTSALRGSIKHKPSARSEFLELARK